MDLALNNLQWLICHQTKPNHTIPNQTKLTDSKENELRQTSLDEIVDGRLSEVNDRRSSDKSVVRIYKPLFRNSSSVSRIFGAQDSLKRQSE